MSRINGKKLLLLMLAGILLVSNAAFAEDILVADERVQEQINYKTETVRIDDYVKTISNSATLYYPMTYSVHFESSNAKFVEYAVKRGDAVKKGDVLARFTIGGSNVQLTRMELALARAEESMVKGIQDRKEKIARTRADIASATDAYEREIGELSLRKLEIELEQYEYRQQYSIDNQKAALAEELDRRRTDVLVSPVDGVVTELAYKKIDDSVSAGEKLVTICDENIVLLRVDNGSVGFRYNMPVTVSVGAGKQQTTLTGRVVAADNAIAESERTGHAFIQLDPYDPEINLRNLKISGSQVLLEDVAVVARKAVTLENGKYFVTKLVNGMVQKRYIEYGLGNASGVWIMNGVSEGDTLVVD